MSNLVPMLCQPRGLPSARLEAELKGERKDPSRLEQREVAHEAVPAFRRFDPYDDRALETCAYQSSKSQNSYSYVSAILFMGARSQEQLLANYRVAIAMLPFDLAGAPEVSTKASRIDRASSGFLRAAVEGDDRPEAADHPVAPGAARFAPRRGTASQPVMPGSPRRAPAQYHD